MASPLRIIVTGLVGLYPVGGVAWDYLQYVIGLARLGHDVYYHEDTWSWPYHPVERQPTADGAYSARFLADFFARYAPDPAARDRILENRFYRHLSAALAGSPSTILRSRKRRIEATAAAQASGFPV